jgi:hypothetical protein
MDPHDDVAVTRTLLSAHDPRAGTVVVHPTPGSRSMNVLTCDLLAALGCPTRWTAPEKTHPGLRDLSAAAAWIHADRITHLVVLRAHLLPGAFWDLLLQLREHTGMDLVMVCHHRDIPEDAAELLRGVDHQVSTHLQQDLPTRPPAPASRTGRQQGLPSLGLSVRTARRIRTGLTSPPHAAALALSLFTGLWAPTVAAIPVAGLSPDADTVTIPTPRPRGIWQPRPPDVVVAVPAPARPLLRAARFFKLLHGATGANSLTLVGTNTRDKVHIRTLTHTAQACSLTLPTQQAPTTSA